MPALRDVLAQKIAGLDAQHRLRQLQDTARDEGVRVRRGGRELVSFSCNDYLGLRSHPHVLAASASATAAGAGASRLVTGNLPLYRQLEAALATQKKSEAALVFGSGYLANIGTIPALVGAGDLIVADKLIHACMIDGAKLSGAKLLRFAHNDVAHASTLLEANRGQYKNCLIMTESVFSMDGDLAPLAELQVMCKKYDAWLLLDDAHGLQELPIQPDVLVGTLSKAAGSYGGFVCGSAELIAYLQSAARSLVFSTGLPPAVLAASLAALPLMTAELSETALKRARQFTTLIELPEAQSQIVPLVLGSEEAALDAANKLEEAGFLVSAIRPPTVPEGTSRLRFSFSALHTEAEVAALAGAVSKTLQVTPHARAHA